jgi:Cu(I)/Ag(I) efflux system membrane fusion protein
VASVEAALHAAEARIDDIADGKILLTHGPFQTLGMPAMTMSFALGRPEVARGFAPGERVKVFVRQTAAGLVVERLEKLEGKP